MDELDDWMEGLNKMIKLVEWIRLLNVINEWDIVWDVWILWKNEIKEWEEQMRWVNELNKRDDGMK